MRADLAVWDVSAIDSAGSWDPAALLLAGPRQVRELYVEGRAVVREGRLATVDPRKVVADATASVSYLADG
jgi:cytosine/adenosine deaminase-related metal-dependent hydrolase